MNDSHRKNINIELLRSIACYYVIIIHTWGTFRLEGGVLNEEVFVGGVLARCAVPVFLLITGYVYNSEKGVLYKWKKFVVRVILPVLLMTFFTSVVMARMIHILMDESQEYISVIEYVRMILTGNLSNLYLSFHFWYVEELITFYLLLPLLQFILCNEERANKIRRFYLALYGVVYFILPVVEKLTAIQGIHFYVMDGLLYIWYIVLGYELSTHTWTKNKTIGRAGIGVHVICIVIMSLLEYFLEYKATGDIQHGFTGQNSIFIVGSAVGLLLFVMSLDIPECLNRTIGRVGKATWGIYVIHVVVYSVLYQLKITVLLEYIPALLFCLIYSTAVFVISFAGIWVLQKLHVFCSRRLSK